MNTRRGLGKGLGTGYKNIAPMDSHIHSLSAKGQATYVEKVFPSGALRISDGKKHQLYMGYSKRDALKKFKSLNAKGSENPTYQEMKSLATEIEAFMKKNKLLTDSAIYFKGKRWSYNSSGKRTVENAKASEYFEYANDKTLSMSFEGGMYGVIDGHYGNYSEDLAEKFRKILKKYGYYYERGNAWNLTLYPD